MAAKSKGLTSITANGDEFFLFTTTSEEETGALSFELILTDTINAWEGSISNKDLHSLCKKIGEDFGKFSEETKAALSKNEATNTIFEYQVKSVREGCMELAWKRVMQDDGIKFQLGSVRLSPSDDPSVHIRALLQHSIEEIAASRTKIRHLECEQDRLSSERGQALKRLEKCVEMKEELDKDLYSKFCVILNEKKAKIRQLQQNGINRADSVGSDHPSSVKTEEDESLRSSASMDVDEGENDISTDEENEMNRGSSGGRKLKRQQKDEDNSLILDEGDDKPTTSHGRRRKRKVEEKPSATTSKLSIPRVPSTPKNASTPSSSTGRNSRTPSLRKTPSSSRRTRNDELDASELFDEI